MIFDGAAADEEEDDEKIVDAMAPIMCADTG
jgi:hypothetical protein